MGLILVLLPPLLVPPALVRAGQPTLSATPDAAIPGATVVVIGMNFEKNAAGYLTFDGDPSVVWEYRASKDGAFQASFVVPRSATLGGHRVSAIPSPPGNSGNAKSEAGGAGGAIATVVLTVEALQSAPQRTPSLPPVSASAAPTASAMGSGSWQPSFPVRAAFYYPWFPEAWNQQGINPFTRYQPSLGLYDSGDDSVILNHITAMQYGNISVGIASWWGQGTRTDGRIASLLNATGARPFRWTVYYEPEGQGDPSVDQIRVDLTYLRDRYASSPAFYRANDKFVVFAYADANDACETADRWAQANATIGAYVVLKVFSGYRDCANQPDGWHQYAPAVAADAQGQYSYSISPGFYLANESVRLSRDPTRWNENVRQMVASGAAFQLVTTFNEWGEGTSVESAIEWTSASGFGAYLDALHAQPTIVTPPPPPPSGNPPVAIAPRILLSTASRVPGAGVPVVVRWGLASSDSGLRRYDLQLKVGSGSFTSRTLSSRTATSYRTTLASARNYVFRVRAVDRAGRVGAWVYSRTTRPSSISDGSSVFRWSGSWSRVRNNAYLGGYVHATRRRSSTATVTFSGASIAWVGPVGPTRGKAYVYLDGVLVTTVNLYRSSYQARRIVFARNLADGQHTLAIKALATSGHPTVAIDGLYVVNPS